MDTVYSPYLHAILWDLDGVLVDSTDIHYLSWTMALEGFGISLERQEFIRFFGQSPDDVAAGILGPHIDLATQVEIRHRKNQNYDRLVLDQARPMPGAKDWLERLHGKMPQAVATSSSHHQASTILRVVGLASYFQVVVTSSDVPGKPAPDIFLKAAHLLNVAPENCLVIEDSPSGVEAAHRGEMKIIAVCTTNTPDALSKADLILPDLTKLTFVHLQTLFPATKLT